MIRNIVLAAMLVAATPVLAGGKGHGEHGNGHGNGGGVSQPSTPSTPSTGAPAPSKPSAPAASVAGPKKGKDVGTGRTNDACDAKASVGNYCPEPFSAQ